MVATKVITKVIASAPTVADLSPSFALSLRAKRRSPRTIQSYLEAVAQLDAHLAENGMPREVASIRREHVESFIVALTQRFRPTTAVVRFKSLQQFWRWCVEEGEVTESPMKNMTPPKRKEEPVPVPSLQDVQAILGTCDTSYEGRRDEAIIRVFADTGIRLSELTGLRVADVDRYNGILRVTGKGDKVRRVAISPKTARALDRYMRLRGRVTRPEVQGLWVGRKGVMTVSGVEQMIRRRSRAVGVAIHPHSLRHYSAHAWLADGQSENALMKVMGWSSRTMVDRYAASTAEDRALAAQREAALGDRL